jgi:hypothetical protein
LCCVIFIRRGVASRETFVISANLFSYGSFERSAIFGRFVIDDRIKAIIGGGYQFAVARNKPRPPK